MGPLRPHSCLCNHLTLRRAAPRTGMGSDPSGCPRGCAGCGIVSGDELAVSPSALRGRKEERRRVLTLLAPLWGPGLGSRPPYGGTWLVPGGCVRPVPWWQRGVHLDELSLPTVGEKRVILTGLLPGISRLLLKMGQSPHWRIEGELGRLTMDRSVGKERRRAQGEGTPLNGGIGSPGGQKGEKERRAW